MPEHRRKFSPEFREEAIKMVTESSQPIARIARELNIKEGTLGNWVNTYRREHAGEEPPLTISERARLRERKRPQVLNQAREDLRFIEDREQMLFIGRVHAVDHRLEISLHHG